MESKINVSLRVKPLSQLEAKSDKNKLWKISSESTLVNSRSNEAFTFDKVFGSEVSTETIFNDQVKDLVKNPLNGINQTIFAYGQTSSGKTFTMHGYATQPSGPQESPSKTVKVGVIPLSVKEIFDHITSDKDQQYKVTVSYMEVSISHSSLTDTFRYTTSALMT